MATANPVNNPPISGGSSGSGTQVTISGSAGQTLTHSGLSLLSGSIHIEAKIKAKTGTASRILGFKLNGSNSIKGWQDYSTITGGVSRTTFANTGTVWLIEASGTLNIWVDIDPFVDGFPRTGRIHAVQEDSSGPSGQTWTTFWWGNLVNALDSFQWVGGASDTFDVNSRSTAWVYA